jgi:transposase-like protein
MMSDLKVEDVLQSIDKFSKDDKKKILDHLVNDVEKQEEPVSVDERSERIPHTKWCPYCGSHNTIRHGTNKGIKRFVCKNCEKSYSETTSYRIFLSKNKERFARLFSATNTLMKNCFIELVTYMESDPKSRSTIQFNISKLADVLFSTIVVHQGCYLLENQLPIGLIPIPEQEFIQPDPYRTGHEEFVNHLHTQDIFQYNNGIQHLLVGMIIANNLRYKLKSMFPTKRFEISVSFHVLPIYEDDIYYRDDCRVSFHAVREGEVYIGDLEGYKYEAVGVIDI